MNTESRTVLAQREAYIAQLTPELQSRLSPLDTFEQLSEIRGHLDAMARAYEELGMTPDVAMESAIAKFGEAGEIGRKISHSVQTPQDLDLRQERIGLAKLLAYDVAVAIVWSQIWNSLAIGLVKPTLTYEANWRFLTANTLPVALTIGVACWYIPQAKPFRMGLVCALLSNLSLPVMLYYVRGAGFFDNALRYSHPGITLGVFLLGVSSVYMANRLRRRATIARRQPIA